MIYRISALLALLLSAEAFAPQGTTTSSLVNINGRNQLEIAQPYQYRGTGSTHSTRQLVRRHFFEQLTESFASITELVKGKQKITEENINEALGEVKRALLDSDVNLKVTNTLIESVKQKALGMDVTSGVSPDQQFIKIMYDELVQTMGAGAAPLARKEGDLEEVGPTVILLAGLQGAGKTTAAAKLALYCKSGDQLKTQDDYMKEMEKMKAGEEVDQEEQKKKKKPRKVLLCAADVYRPAAIDQLQTLGGRIGVEVFEQGRDVDPVDVATAAIEYAKENRFDTVIVDTAGRQVVDEGLMEELKNIEQATNADETLLVVDAMTGQEAATLTARFAQQVSLTGAILTKLDGDSRGGAALSVQGVSGKPIKFIGVGETLEKLQPFYPERMASRILGMGDVISLVEKAQDQVSQDEAEAIAQKMKDRTFDFDDFLKQSQLISNIGNMAGVMNMVPGLAGKIDKKRLDDAEDRLEIASMIINAMTPEERKNPELFIRDTGALARQKRIAEDTPEEVEFKDVQNFISDFQRMRTMMGRMAKNMGIGDIGTGDEEDIMTSMTSRSQRRKQKRQAAMGGDGDGPPDMNFSAVGGGSKRTAAVVDKSKLKAKRKAGRKNKRK